MGCGQSFTAAVQQGVQEYTDLKKNKKKRGEATPPEVDQVVCFRGYGTIGTVKSVDTKSRRVVIHEIGSNDEATYSYGDYRGNQEWTALSDEPALLAFAPSMEVTANYCGSEVNGYVTDLSGDKLLVRFRPDEAHSMEKTNWKLGTSDASELKAGHHGADRPRNRTREEISAEEQKVKSYGVSYICCGSCRQGVWEDPCGGYTGGGKKGIFCQQCGRQASGGDKVCCGDLVSKLLRFGSHGCHTHSEEQVDFKMQSQWFCCR